MSYISTQNKATGRAVTSQRSQIRTHKINTFGIRSAVWGTCDIGRSLNMRIVYFPIIKPWLDTKIEEFGWLGLYLEFHMWNQVIRKKPSWQFSKHRYKYRYKSQILIIIYLWWVSVQFITRNELFFISDFILMNIHLNFSDKSKEWSKFLIKI